MSSLSDIEIGRIRGLIDREYKPAMSPGMGACIGIVVVVIIAVVIGLLMMQNSPQAQTVTRLLKKQVKGRQTQQPIQKIATALSNRKTFKGVSNDSKTTQVPNMKRNISKRINLKKKQRQNQQRPNRFRLTTDNSQSTFTGVPASDSSAPSSVPGLTSGTTQESDAPAQTFTSEQMTDGLLNASLMYNSPESQVTRVPSEANYSSMFLYSDLFSQPLPQSNTTVRTQSSYEQIAKDTQNDLHSQDIASMNSTQ